MQCQESKLEYLYARIKAMEKEIERLKELLKEK